MQAQWLGRVDHEQAVARMELARHELLENRGGPVLFLAEHSPVITLGRSASPQEELLLSVDELAARGVSVVHASRGGLATFHGPGQLMIYPVTRVRSVVGFLRAIAEALAESVATFGIEDAQWRRQPAGLWVRNRKLAACGIHLRRGVTNHGFALNVSSSRQVWQWFRPCGLDANCVTSMAEELGDNLDVEAVAEVVTPRVLEALSASSR